MLSYNNLYKSEYIIHKTIDMTNYVKSIIDNTSDNLYKSNLGLHRHNTRSVKRPIDYKYTIKDFEELMEILKIESQINGFDETTAKKISDIYECLREHGFIGEYLNLNYNTVTYFPRMLFNYGVEMAKYIGSIRTYSARQKMLHNHRKRILNVIFIRSFSSIESEHKDYTIYQDFDELLTDMLYKLETISCMFGVDPREN